MPKHHPLVQLARAAIEMYVLEGRSLDPAEMAPPDENAPAGAFVTLHTASTGELRGCIGTIVATMPSLAEEVVANAISAATRDPRFLPVQARELADLEIDVSVLEPPEPIQGPEELNPAIYGVIVQHGWRRGLLLPDIPGIDDAATQVRYARLKAGIGPSEAVKLERFRVEKYT